jgi:hypothetical protein
MVPEPETERPGANIDPCGLGRKFCLDLFFRKKKMVARHDLVIGFEQLKTLSGF